MVIVGTVIDDAIEDRLRVTMVATGLGGAAAKRTPNIQLVETVNVRTGTDDGLPLRHKEVTYDDLDTPAVVRKGRAASSGAGLPAYDAPEIPAFLRKQAD
jgi:cell division protein FtsZ